uniref:Uncharacterized protein n=1 Tax=Nelumbo nucifera TaxID=4432 RepID=A0A822ZU93_NELNU|nr:TPA_asm: hypothetical protein HUJ06_003688 [Nelumbo nucifera]
MDCPNPRYARIHLEDIDEADDGWVDCGLFDDEDSNFEIESLVGNMGKEEAVAEEQNSHLNTNWHFVEEEVKKVLLSLFDDNW